MVLPIEKFSFLVLARDMIKLQHFNILFSLHYLSSGRLRRLKSKTEKVKSAYEPSGPPGRSLSRFP